MAFGSVGLGEQVQTRLALQGHRIEKSDALAETVVDLLQSDQLRADLLENLDDAVRPHLSVGAPAFVDVVGRDLQADSSLRCKGTSISRRRPAIS